MSMIADIPSGPLAFDVFSDSSRSVTSSSEQRNSFGQQRESTDKIQSCYWDGLDGGRDTRSFLTFISF